MHAGQYFPVLAAVVRTEQIARLLILDAPGRNENVLGILWIDCDVVENIIVAAA